MNKWLSRTFWLVISILVASSVFLLLGKVTEAVWSGVVTNILLYWVGGDVLNKSKFSK